VTKTVRRQRLDVSPVSESWLRQHELHRGKHPEGC
jgi:hypothetical protein